MVIGPCHDPFLEHAIDQQEGDDPYLGTKLDSLQDKTICNLDCTLSFFFQDWKKRFKQICFKHVIARLDVICNTRYDSVTVTISF